MAKQGEDLVDGNAVRKGMERNVETTNEVD